MHLNIKVKSVVIAGWLSILTGMLVGIGWVFHVQALLSVFPGYVSMKFNAALCFILLGAVLYLTQNQFKKYNTIVPMALSFVIILISTISLSQDLFHFNAGIDQLLIADKASIAKKYPYPGRMAINTAICFILFGLAFLGFSINRRFIDTVSQYFLHLITAISAISVIGYLYGFSLYYNLYFASSMPVHTSLLFFSMSIIASLLHPSIGITNLFTGKLVGNVMARRLFALIVVLVVILGYLKVQSLHYQLFSVGFGFSLLVICFSVMGLAIIWHTANWLNGIDAKRYEAEEKVKALNKTLEKRVEQRSAKLIKLLANLRESESKFRAAFQKSAIGMALVSLKGKWLKVNKGLCDMVGYKEEEMLTMTFQDITHRDDLKGRAGLINGDVMGGNDTLSVEKRYICSNGSIVWVSVNLAKVMDSKGGPLYFVGQFEDITERKQAEKDLKAAYKQIKEHIIRIQDMTWKQSHLMRRPLANLKGLAGALKNHPDDKEILSYIQIELESLDKVIIDLAEEASKRSTMEIVARKRSFKATG